ncbi:Nuclear condensin complex subunit 3, C-terminal domain [Dillenia turbinata]|uniref:Nuclear condensin complex subunit 3, C-terminal domain n=1 Tax=Dillenia turbinata TaxID=194707 RepID=A0AAN8Z624_9MAGN
MISFPHLGNDRKAYSSVILNNASEDLNIELLDLLFAAQAVLGEGFAKILLLSEKYPSLSDSTQPLILSKLISLYFANETKDLERLKQCLSVFFENYPTISANHKKCLSEAFIKVMHSMWPGID